MLGNSEPPGLINSRELLGRGYGNIALLNIFASERLTGTVHKCKFCKKHEDRLQLTSAFDN